MTVGVVIRVPGQGAVLACDGRIADDQTSAIYTDHEEKFGEFGSAVGIYAGAIGGLWHELRETPPRGWRELREALKDIDATESHDRDYEVLVYDRTSDRVLWTSHQAEATLVRGHAAIGCGGPIALGVLDAAKTPNTLEAAAKLALRAIKIACRRNAACGGRIRTVIVRGKRRKPEVR